jgi:SAM-dependent methyltransferase
MSQETFQLAGNTAEIYEDQKVPAIFGPLAEAMLNVVPLSQNDRVLDVACGTGVVARKVRERIGPTARVVGADLNEGMIATAGSLNDKFSRSCEWYVSDAANMSFGDGEFSMIFCQQGLQFFPDEAAALKEMKRVLCPGGRIALTIWSGPSVFFTVMAEALAKHVDQSVAEKSLAPFAYRGRDTLEAHLSALGFIDVTRQEISVDRVITDPETSIPKEIMGNPVGSSVAEKGEETMQRIVTDILSDISDFRRGSDLVVPQLTHLFQGKVG